jgi:hypothetical protein
VGPAASSGDRGAARQTASPSFGRATILSTDLSASELTLQEIHDTVERIEIQRRAQGLYVTERRARHIVRLELQCSFPRGVIQLNSWRGGASRPSDVEPRQRTELSHIITVAGIIAAT